MNDDPLFKRIAAITAIFSGILQLVTIIISISAVGVVVELLAEPIGMITLGDRGADMFRWAWTLSIFGYYLLLAPAVVYLSSWLNSRNDGLIRTATIFGLVYIIAGAISVAIMVGAMPPMMHTFAEASGSLQETMLGVFRVVTDMVFFGVSPLAFAAGGLWWLGTGVALLNQQLILAIITLILGAGTLGSAIGFFLQVELLARLEMVNYFLAPIWAIWIGIMFAQRTEMSKISLEQASTA